MRFRLRWLPVPILGTLGTYVGLAYQLAPPLLVTVDVLNAPPGATVRGGPIVGSLAHHKSRYGATFDYLGDQAGSYTCLEPDAALCAELSQRLASHRNPPRVVSGTLQTLPEAERFDTIVYIDVLEHIEHDRQELVQAAERLAAGGCLIVLSPALPALFSPFDRSVGHFRRYTRRTLGEVAPSGLTIKDWFYLDGVGVLASLFARVAKRSAPTPAQISTWDKLIVPVSRFTDVFTSRLFGRTIVMVWSKPG